MGKLSLYLTTLFFAINSNLEAADLVRISETEALISSSLAFEGSSGASAAAIEINVEAITECISRTLPTLLDAKSAKGPKELATRIIKLYRDRLTENPNFYQLIEPLITIESDAAGSFHLSIVMSDFYLSCLHLYEKLKFFTYEGLLKELERPNGQERYMFAMKRMSSFPHPTELSRKVWHDIFTLQEDHFEMLKSIMIAADQYPLFKLEVLPEVFKAIFQQSNWDKGYWDRFSAALKRVDLTIESADEPYQKTMVHRLLLDARQRVSPFLWAARRSGY